MWVAETRLTKSKVVCASCCRAAKSSGFITCAFALRKCTLLKSASSYPGFIGDTRLPSRGESNLPRPASDSIPVPCPSLSLEPREIQPVLLTITLHYCFSKSGNAAFHNFYISPFPQPGPAPQSLSKHFPMRKMFAVCNF